MKPAIITLALLLSIVLGFSFTSSRSQVATASAAAAVAAQTEQAATAPALTGVGVDQLQLNAPDSEDCEKNATSDAATCATGGWVFHIGLGCCSLRTGLAGRWQKGSSIKCCGACGM